MIPAALLTVAVIAAAGITAYLLRPQPAAPPVQTALPFTGLAADSVVAVDTAGNLYVTLPDCPACTDNPNNHNRVVKLSAGSSNPVELAFTGLAGPRAVAVDTAGNVYVADGNDQVLKLAAASSTPTVLPFTGLDIPEGVAVDSGGNLYVADLGNTANHGRVVKLAAGSSTQTVLPFTGLSTTLGGVAVDSAGNLYVTDFANDRVVRLAAGSSTQTVLPFTGLSGPQGVAVDSAGNLYVADPLQQPGAETGGGLEQARRCCRSPTSSNPGLWRWTPPATSTSTDPGKKSGGETVGGLMRRTAGARGCRADPTEHLSYEVQI